MDVELNFEAEFIFFVSNMDTISDMDNYWGNVAKGIVILFKYRDIINDKNKMLNCFNKIKEDIIRMYPNNSMEDFIDEFTAIFIGWYPMPDFWSASLDDFKSHVNFNKHFRTR